VNVGFGRVTRLSSTRPVFAPEVADSAVGLALPPQATTMLAVTAARIGSSFRKLSRVWRYRTENAHWSGNP
jgi:hypothetical protein